MFTEKIKTLLPDVEKRATERKTAPASKANAFLNAAKERAARTLSGNGALKYSETDNDFVTEFGVLGSYKAPRSYSDVATTMSILWAKDANTALKLTFYIRLITRTVNLPNGTKTEAVQRGQGLKSEGILRMMWIAVNHPDTFWKNILFFIASGSWQDIIKMLSLDLQYHGWKGRILNWDMFGQLILASLVNPHDSELIKKYLPTIKSNAKCKTIESQADNVIGKWICSLVNGEKISDGNYKTYKRYRKLKSGGTAHTWQQLISQKKMLQINFNSIHGRALSQLVGGKFLKNNGLEQAYAKWIEGQPIAKYTGYAYELMCKLSSGATQNQIHTINAQFMGLVETAMKGASTGTGMIVVRDTSGSMSSVATGTQYKCGDVAKSLALFFSYMLPEGKFANSWIEFNSDARLHEWKGSTPVEKWRNDRSGYIGGTDFQSVIRLLCSIKRQGIAESEFPNGILCISDGEFNPTQLGIANVSQALVSLKSAGFSDEYVAGFKIVLWNLQSRYYGNKTGKKFETHDTRTPNVFYFSGLDGSVVAFLTGISGKESKTPSTAAELFEAAMDQQLLNLLEV